MVISFIAVTLFCFELYNTSFESALNDTYYDEKMKYKTIDQRRSKARCIATLFPIECWIAFNFQSVVVILSKEAIVTKLAFFFSIWMSVYILGFALSRLEHPYSSELTGL